jgi:hypothetical protein
MWSGRPKKMHISEKDQDKSGKSGVPAFLHENVLPLKD